MTASKAADQRRLLPKISDAPLPVIKEDSSPSNTHYGKLRPISPTTVLTDPLDTSARFSSPSIHSWPSPASVGLQLRSRVSPDNPAKYFVETRTEPRVLGSRSTLPLSSTPSGGCTCPLPSVRSGERLTALDQLVPLWGQQRPDTPYPDQLARSISWPTGALLPLSKPASPLEAHRNAMDIPPRPSSRSGSRSGSRSVSRWPMDRRREQLLSL